MADAEFAAFYAALVREEGGEPAAAGSGEAPQVVRAFSHQRGEWFTAHGRTAEWVADAHFNTRDVLKKRAGLAYVNLSPKKLAAVLRDALVERKLRAELYDREGASQPYRLAKRGSPGNLQDFEALLGAEAVAAGEAAAGEDPASAAASSVVMAVCVAAADGPGATAGQRVVGVSFVDTGRRVIELGEFVDDDKFSGLRAAVLQHGPRECVMPRAPGGADAAAANPDSEHARLAAVMAECRVPVTERPAGEFKRAEAGASSAVEQDLRRLVGHLQQQFVLLERRAALGSLQSLVRYAELARDESGHGRWRLEAYDLGQFMRLDAAAMQALNVFPAASDSNRNMSLYGLLNRCCSASGSRLLSRWLKQPLLDTEALGRRHDLVEALTEGGELRDALRTEYLKGMPDLRQVARRFQRRKGDLELLVKLYGFLVRVPALVDALNRYEGPHDERLVRGEVAARVQALLAEFSQLEAMTEATVDLEAVGRHEYVVAPSFTPALGELASLKRDALRDMESIARDVADDVGLDEARVKLMHAGTSGYHLRVTRKDEKNIRGGGYITLETRKDGVRFTTPQLRGLSRRYEELSREYGSVQSEIVNKCMEVVLTYTPVMEELDAVLAELDVLASFAHVAVSAPVEYVRPEMRPVGGGVIELRESRHPCVEVQDGVSFIANDVVLRRGEGALQIITGPNMGGKSTYIRQTGAVVLMAQVGCFVPCASATISCVDCVLARVGAGDSQLRGVSTFMKEMLEASSILRSSTKDSLLIIDELGRGTSTYDGFGLAWAIAEHIARDLGCFSMFATHFHELTALADTLGRGSGVVNRHVTAHTDDGAITMLYKVRDGPCDRSFGIHVSEIAQFPPSVVAMARAKAAELEDFGSRVAVTPGKRKAAGDAGKAEEEEAGGDGDEPPAKRARTERFLRAFAELPLGEAASDEERARRVLEFKTAMEAEGLLEA